MEFKSWATVNEDVDSSKTFHMITWYIDKPLTLKQWSELDDKMSDVLESFVGDEFMGYAGPIPFDDWYEEAIKIYNKENNAASSDI